jgi:hypothetical protein
MARVPLALTQAQLESDHADWRTAAVFPHLIAPKGMSQPDSGKSLMALAFQF